MAFAETSSTSVATLIAQLQAQIATLTAQITALKAAQQNVQTARKEMNATLKELRGQIACGATGDDVATLQTILAADSSIFPEGIISGYYGPKTREAVKRFQRMTGLTPTGCVGPQTLNALNRFLKSHPIIVQDGTVCALVVNGEKPQGWKRKLDRERDRMGMSEIPTCSGGIPQSILSLFGIASTTPVVPGNSAPTADELVPGSGKITLCHKYNNQKVTIYVSPAAYLAHLGHGDKLGACSGTTTPPPPPPPPTGDTTAPAISNVQATGIGLFGATLTWATNEPATSQVEYGNTTPYGLMTSPTSVYVTSHSVTISGLASSSTVNYRVISKDFAGNTASSSNGVFTTTSPDNTPPAISGVSSSGIGSTTATVGWNTNENATGKVYYSTSNPVDLNSALSVNNAALTASHLFSLTGLTASTTYHYVVESKDAANNTATSSQLIFTTQ
jgi:hypothetical protein